MTEHLRFTECVPRLAEAKANIKGERSDAPWLNRNWPMGTYGGTQAIMAPDWRARAAIGQIAPELAQSQCVELAGTVDPKGLGISSGQTGVSLKSMSGLATNLHPMSRRFRKSRRT
jgi:hypothetical protein